MSLSNLSEAEILFKDLDLGKISTSFTINGTAAIIYAMYLAVADKQGVPRSKLTGTIQNDILKEYVARGTWIFPVRPSMRLIADSILYSNDVTPRFNPISIAGAHVRDAGATAAEEMAYTLANGLAYVDELQRRGGDVEKFAKRLSFFFYVHMDFFDEIAKFRAGRRLWARFMKERYAVQDPKAQHFRFGVVCGGSSLVAPQPYNNAVRVAVETMAAVFGGAQSIFTCAFDEAFQIPTEFSAELAVRTQQMIAYESGIGRTVDPLGGSYFLEQHTDRMEEMIVKVMDEIDAYGGVVPAIEDGWIQLRLAERGLERKLDTDSGKAPIVGQNYFRKADEKIGVGDVFKLDPTVAQRALEKFEKVLDTRSQAAVDASLAKLVRCRGQGQRERDALPGGVLPCLRHGGGDGGLPEEGMGRIQGTGESMNETQDGTAARWQAHPGGQAGTGRTRHRREDRRAHAARCRRRGDLHRPAAQPGADRAGGGGRRRRRSRPEHPLRQPQGTGQGRDRRTARAAGQRHQGIRRRHHPRRGPCGTARPRRVRRVHRRHAAR